MYLSLGKKGRTGSASRRVTVQDTPASPTHGPSGGAPQTPLSAVPPGGPLPDLPPSPMISAYSLYYPQDVLSKITLVEEDRNQAQSKEFTVRTVDRIKKRSFFTTNSAVFAPFKEGNLAAVHRGFTQHTASDGTLTLEAYGDALQTMGVNTADGITERTFTLFDVRKKGQIEYIEVISALDVILNGVNSHITCADCFALLDPSHCGYVIRNVLVEMRMNRDESHGVTHLMIKSVIDIIDKMQAADAEKFLKAFAKASGKRRKRKDDSTKGKSGAVTPGVRGLLDASKRKSAAKPPPVGPPQFEKRLHLSYEEFCECLAKDPLLVQAFLGRVLATIESVYLRNKNAPAPPAAASSGSATPPPPS